LIDRMERQGMVRRSRSSKDQRARCVRLTPAGRDLLATVQQGHARQIELLFMGLGQGEVVRMCSLLTRMGDHLESLAAQAPPWAQETAPARPARKQESL
jgi:DNA-binding MarR family transcriptional regulator